MEASAESVAKENQAAWRRIADRALVAAPAERRLTLANGELGMKDAMARPELEVREWPVYRAAAVSLAVLGAVLALVGLAGRPGVLPWGVAFVLLGGSAAGLLMVLPAMTRVPVLASQRQEWEACCRRFRQEQRWSWIAAGVAWGGAALGAVFLVWLPAAAGFIIAVAVAAAAAWLVLTARAPVHREVIRQTLLLQELERRGLAPAGTLDPRVRTVLAALDRLLGDLPDSAVQRFLASEESNLFLELLAEVRQ